MATGIQDSFSWEGVALSAIGGGVGAGLGQIGGAVGKVLNANGFVSGAVRGVVGSAITQGIGVVTGLQSKFDWVGVAAAGVAGGVSSEIGLKGFGGAVVRNAAAGLAGAATRSLLDGTDFGDNILAALPDIIGGTIGNMVAGAVAGGGKMSPGEQALVAEAEKSANRVSAAEADRRYRGELVNLAVASAEVEQAAAQSEYGDIVVTGQLRNALYTRGVDQPLFFQIGGGSSRNSRARIGGNGGPPLEDWRALRQIGVPQMNGPAGAIFGVLDNLFDAPIARKGINTFQVRQFYTSPKVQSVFIVRPTSMGGSYFLPMRSR